MVGVCGICGVCRFSVVAFSMSLASYLYLSTNF